jgi:hypothetical protein
MPSGVRRRRLGAGALFAGCLMNSEIRIEGKIDVIISVASLEQAMARIQLSLKRTLNEQDPEAKRLHGIFPVYLSDLVIKADQLTGQAHEPRSS